MTKKDLLSATDQSLDGSMAGSMIGIRIEQGSMVDHDRGVTFR